MHIIPREPNRRRNGRRLMQPAEIILSQDACAIARMPASVFKTMVSEGNYPAAPAATTTKRVWSIDDLTCLWYCRTLLLAGMPQSMAGKWAGLLADAIEREPQATRFNVYVWEDLDRVRGHGGIGTSPPAEAPHAQVLSDLPIAKLRRNVHAAHDAYYARKAKRDARRF